MIHGYIMKFVPCSNAEISKKDKYLDKTFSCGPFSFTFSSVQSSFTTNERDAVVRQKEKITSIVGYSSEKEMRSKLNLDDNEDEENYTLPADDRIRKTRGKINTEAAGAFAKYSGLNKRRIKFYTSKPSKNKKIYVFPDGTYESQFLETLIMFASYLFSQIILMGLAGLKDTGLHNFRESLLDPNSTPIILNVYSSDIADSTSDDNFSIDPEMLGNIILRTNKSGKQNIKLNFIEQVMVKLWKPSEILNFTNGISGLVSKPTTHKNAMRERNNAIQLERFDGVSTRRLFDNNDNIPPSSLIAMATKNDKYIRIINFVTRDTSHNKKYSKELVLPFEPVLLIHKIEHHKDKEKKWKFFRRKSSLLNQFTDVKTIKMIENELPCAFISTSNVNGIIDKDNCIVQNRFELLRKLLPDVARENSIADKEITLDRLINNWGTNRHCELDPHGIVYDATKFYMYIQELQSGGSKAIKDCIKYITRSIYEELRILHFCGRIFNPDYDVIEKLHELFYSNPNFKHIHFSNAIKNILEELDDVEVYQHYGESQHALLESVLQIIDYHKKEIGIDSLFLSEEYEKQRLERLQIYDDVMQRDEYYMDLHEQEVNTNYFPEYYERRDNIYESQLRPIKYRSELDLSNVKQIPNRSAMYQSMGNLAFPKETGTNIKPKKLIKQAPQQHQYYDSEIRRLNKRVEEIVDSETEQINERLHYVDERLNYVPIQNINDTVVEPQYIDPHFVQDKEALVNRGKYLQENLDLLHNEIKNIDTELNQIQKQLSPDTYLSPTSTLQTISEESSITKTGNLSLPSKKLPQKKAYKETKDSKPYVDTTKSSSLESSTAKITITKSDDSSRYSTMKPVYFNTHIGDIVDDQILDLVSKV